MSNRNPTLTEQLGALEKRYNKVVPHQVLDALAELQCSFQPSASSPPAAPSNPSLTNALKNSTGTRKIIQPGQPLPDFALPDLTGTKVSINPLVGHGCPVLITFYRGGWCPFDNLTLRSLQHHLDEFDSMGCALVAISPETPANLAKTAERIRIHFPVLSDTGNRVAGELGIVWTMPGYLREICKKCLDLGKWNGIDEEGEGEGEYELPIPASLLVNGRGVVRRVFVEPDWRKRLDTRAALDWVDELLREEEEEKGGCQRVYDYGRRREDIEEVRLVRERRKGEAPEKFYEAIDFDVDWSGVWN